MVSFTKALMEVMERDMKYKRDKDVVMLKRNGRLTFTDSNFDNLPFQEITNNDININWELFEEEDNWNLADNYFNEDLFAKDEIKTFIQKVKEDVKKKSDGMTNAIYHNTLFKIIDKRAGDL